MDRDDINRALQRILLDWKSRKSRNLTTSLPADFTSSTLKFIRRVGGSKPAQPQLMEMLLSSTPPDDEGPKLLTVLELETKLFGRDYNGRLWRRYANEEGPIKPDDFRRIVVRAWQAGWLSIWQLITIFQNIAQMEATNTSLKRLRNRLVERLTPWNRTNQEKDFEKLLDEVNDIHDKIFSRNTDRGRRHVQRMAIPADLKAWILATNLPQSESNVGEDELS